MSDFDSVVLGDDEILVLRPKEPLSPEWIGQLNSDLPVAMRGRVLVVDPSWDVLVVKQL